MCWWKLCSCRYCCQSFLYSESSISITVTQLCRTQQVDTHSLFPPLSGTLACMISRCTMNVAAYRYALFGLWSHGGGYAHYAPGETSGESDLCSLYMFSWSPFALLLWVWYLARLDIKPVLKTTRSIKCMSSIWAIIPCLLWQLMSVPTLNIVINDAQNRPIEDFDIE